MSGGGGEVAGDWCAGCNIPLGLGACRACRELAWSVILNRSAPKPEPAPDTKLFALAVSVGMGAAAEIVRREWGGRYAACILAYVKQFDAKNLASVIEAASAGETQSGSTEGESAVPTADAQNPPNPKD